MGCEELFSVRRLTQAGGAPAGGGSSKAVECGGPSGGLQGGLVGRHNLTGGGRHGNSAVPQQRESPEATQRAGQAALLLDARRLLGAPE